MVVKLIFILFIKFFLCVHFSSKIIKNLFKKFIYIFNSFEDIGRTFGI